MFNVSQLGQALVTLVAIALVSIGAIAFVMPARAAKKYGIDAHGPVELTFMRAMAARDFAVGTLLALLLANAASPRVLAGSLWATAIIAAADYVLVSRHKGPASARALHGLGAVFLVVVSSLWLAQS